MISNYLSHDIYQLPLVLPLLKVLKVQELIKKIIISKMQFSVTFFPIFTPQKNN